MIVVYTAANFVPSAEEVMDCQFLPGAPSAFFQVVPESDDSQIKLLEFSLSFSTAAILVPSAEEATYVQVCPDV